VFLFQFAPRKSRGAMKPNGEGLWRARGVKVEGASARALFTWFYFRSPEGTPLP
jgi:hypothetical protein